MKNILSIGDILDNRYKVVSHFQNGTYGPLYIISHKSFPMEFILKINLNKELLSSSEYTLHQLEFAQLSPIERTRNEANLLAKLNHPNIIKPSDIIEDIRGKGSGLILEQISNVKTLADVIEERKQELSKGLFNFKDPTTMDYIFQLNKAIEYIRSQNIIHKDIKPENILLDSESLIKIIDFGMACSVDENNDLFANRLYAPPESHLQEQHINSDLWSFSLIALELMTGNYLFGEKDKEKVYEKLDFSRRKNVIEFINLTSSIYHMGEFERYVEMLYPNKVADIYRLIKGGLHPWEDKRHDDTSNLTTTPYKKVFNKHLKKFIQEYERNPEEANHYFTTQAFHEEAIKEEIKAITKRYRQKKSSGGFEK